MTPRLKIDVPVTSNYAFLKSHSQTHKIKVLEGSSGSGKTYSILQYLIERMMLSTIRVGAFRHDRATTSDTIVEDFRNVMVMMGQWDERRWRDGKKTYTFANGSTIKFRGTSDAGKLHGARWEIVWLNEVMEINYKAFKQLSMRTNQEVIMDFNPSLNIHWVFTKIMGRSNCAYNHSTFKDNPMLPNEDRLDILSSEPTEKNKAEGSADDWHWQVYGLGKRGRREGAIFKNWDTTDFMPDWKNCQRHGYGLDYGYTDPTALTECGLFQDVLYLKESIYEEGLICSHNPLEPSIQSIQGRMDKLNLYSHARIHADSAAADNNAALRVAGYKIIPCKKGKDSILHGIDRLKGFRLMVHEDSMHLQFELENYIWDSDASGQIVSTPVDDNNHAIDGVRYWGMGELEPVRSDRSGGRKRSSRAKSNLRKWR